MAAITLQIVVSDLADSQLDGFSDKFYGWLKTAYKGDTAPDGVIEEVSESDREEDTNGEED